MSKPASLPWFAAHEFGLFWRDWLSMMTAGKASRERMLALFITIAAIFMHLLAFVILSPITQGGISATIPVLVFIAGTLLLSFSLMVSQAVESVTRAFYARDDLDLIMSSPAMVERLFAVRIWAIAGTTLAISLLLAFPFINVMAYLDGLRWLAAYGVLAAMAAFATAIAVSVVIFLFATFGPARTRFVAQLVAGLVGAAFVIGIQIVAILYYGNISRLDVLTSQMVYANAPDLMSGWWIPVRAVIGEAYPFALTMAAGFGALAVAITLTAPKFGNSVIAASGVSRRLTQSKKSGRQFRSLSAAQALRRKEWILLARDPWLISQTLMQILYLLPPAFLLWRNFSHNASAFIIVVPVIVMAAGQLAGGLAWLAVSGEDAPDIVSTAPIHPRSILIAKIEAVMIAIGIIVSPLILALVLADAWTGLIAAIGVLICAFSSITIQLWFRKQARRSHFRRRQISSRAATIAEAFSSILWAGAAGVAAAGSWLALGLAIPAVLVLLIAKKIAPVQD